MIVVLVWGIKVTVSVADHDTICVQETCDRYLKAVAALGGEAESRLMGSFRGDAMNRAYEHWLVLETWFKRAMSPDTPKQPVRCPICNSRGLHDLFGDGNFKAFHFAKMGRCDKRSPSSLWHMRLFDNFLRPDMVSDFTDLVDLVDRMSKPPGSKPEDPVGQCVRTFASGNPHAKQLQKRIVDIVGMFLTTCRHQIPVLHLDMPFPGGESFAYPLLCLVYLASFGCTVDIWWYDVVCRWKPYADRMIQQLLDYIATPAGQANASVKRNPWIREGLLALKAKKPLCVLGIWHAYAHDGPCFETFAPVVHKGTGNVSGEACETVWSLSNRHIKWRYHSLATRATHVCAYFDWLIETRIQNLPNLLSTWLSRAVTRFEECSRQLSEQQQQLPLGQVQSQQNSYRQPTGNQQQMIPHTFTKSQLEFVHLRLYLIFIRVCKPMYRWLFVRNLKQAPGSSPEDVTAAVCEKLQSRIDTLIRLGRVTPAEAATTTWHQWFQQAACVVAQSIVVSTMGFITTQVRSVLHLNRQKGAQRLPAREISRKHSAHVRYIEAGVSQMLAWRHFLSDTDIWPNAALVQFVPQLSSLPSDLGTAQVTEWLKSGHLPWEDVYASSSKHPSLMLERYREERERTAGDVRSLISWIEQEIKRLKLLIDKVTRADASTSAAHANMIARAVAATRPDAEQPRAISCRSLVSALTDPAFERSLVQTSLLLYRRKMQEAVQLQQLSVQRFKQWESEVGPIVSASVPQQYLLPESNDFETDSESDIESDGDLEQPILI